MSGAAGWGALAQLGQDTFNWYQARDMRQYNRGTMQMMQQWQEHMSNTAMQRRVADLKKAGLNPMLAYVQGGASPGTGGAVTSGVGKGSEMGRIPEQIANVQQMKENTKLIEKQQEVADSQAKLNEANSEKAKAEAKLKSGQAKIFSATGNVAQDAEGLYEAAQHVIKYGWDNFDAQAGMRYGAELVKKYGNDQNAMKVIKSAIDKLGKDPKMRNKSKNGEKFFKDVLKSLGDKFKSGVNSINRWLGK